MGRFRTVVDAVAADLVASVPLPGDFRIIKYAHPLPGMMVPDKCPALGVFIVRYPRRIIATPGTYEWDLDMQICWYESGASYGETAGATDNDLPGRLLDTMEAISDHLETYATSIPGLPQIGLNLPAYGTIASGETGDNQGMVWRGMQELTVTGTALRAIP